MAEAGEPPVFTIGHSTRSLEELLELLRGRRVELVADIRAFPGSRRLPHFSRRSLERDLPLTAIGYVHLPGLGGRRQGLPDSPNQGWRSASFRAYADHMMEPSFQEGLETLLELSSRHRVAIMCAEAVPWRCHRSLVADALTARGREVRHIMGPGRAELHTMTPFARVEGGAVTYPAPGRDRGVRRPPRGQ